MRLTSTLLVLLNMFASASSAETVGYREIRVASHDDSRRLTVSLWYPAQSDGTPETVGDNAVFSGVPVSRDAGVAGGGHPLVVLSHGYGGNRHNLTWLAAALADEGYVVAAPDHQGTSTLDKDPQQAARLWERPRDLRRVIDGVADALGGAVDTSHVAAVGHSLGGWTVAALAGAGFDADQFAADCAAHPNPRVCGLAGELGIAASVGKATPLDEDMSAGKINAVVTLDFALARGFSRESIGALRTPFLLIGASVDIGDLPASMESGAFASLMTPGWSRYVELGDASHFSFMQICKPGAVEILEEESRGSGILCGDGGEKSRAEIHREVAYLVGEFLDKTLEGHGGWKGASPGRDPSGGGWIPLK